MNRKILIFTHSAAGHHPEYLHHLYMGIIEYEGLEAVIAVPEYIQSRRSLFDWPECKRITFDFIPDEKVSWGDGKWYKRNYRFAKMVRYYAQKHRPDEVFLLDPMMCMPYLAFMIPRGICVSGIIYGIYLYRWRELSWLRRLAELAWHWLLAKRQCFKTVFILNDTDSAEHFNQTYHSSHFRPLPDPVLPLPPPEIDFRDKYHISPERSILFHFGSFGKKKGTLEILQSALGLPEEEQQRYCFVFVGCVQSAIREDFYRLKAELEQTNVQCLVFDEFCSYQFIGDWCRTCDSILVPYLMAYNSSGCIGYAAQCNKPVIGPSYGLLGKLIRKYSLGLQLDEITPQSLLEAYRSIPSFICDGSAYLRDNSVAAFQNTIL
jgi:glycosyltransferase involved in cell wall biosynthesis